MTSLYDRYEMTPASYDDIAMASEGMSESDPLSREQCELLAQTVELFEPYMKVGRVPEADTSDNPLGMSQRYKQIYIASDMGKLSLAITDEHRYSGVSNTLLEGLDWRCYFINIDCKDLSMIDYTLDVSPAKVYIPMPDGTEIVREQMEEVWVVDGVQLEQDIYPVRGSGTKMQVTNNQRRPEFANEQSGWEIIMNRLVRVHEAFSPDQIMNEQQIIKLLFERGGISEARDRLQAYTLATS